MLLATLIVVLFVSIELLWVIGMMRGWFEREENETHAMGFQYTPLEEPEDGD